ncbi:hypothetical protein [Persephonella sp.]|uniref:hypothetical protein n=1 Tax=Persephonella sp. TaxID=2060922 RepID=UPI00262205C4|nr:hypothetical protein [Persephonella sp.]
MKKLLIILLVIGYSFAQTGSQIFEAKCAQCHLLETPPDNLNLEAPPMDVVMRQASYVYRNEQSFIQYLKDFLQNPSTEKSICLPCVKRWGLMPPVNITSYEAEELSVWLFRRFISTGRINP